MKFGQSTRLAILMAHSVMTLVILAVVLLWDISEWWLAVTIPGIIYCSFNKERVLSNQLLGVIVLSSFVAGWIKYGEPVSQTFIQVVAIAVFLWILNEIIFRELRSRELMNERLRMSEEGYRRLFQGSKDGIVYLERNLKPTLLNDYICEVTGYPREELVNISFIDLVHPDDRERVFSNAQRRFHGQTIDRTYEFRGIRKSGEIIDVEGSFDPVSQDGEVVGIQVVVRDITERKRAHNALLESEERYSLLFEGAEEGIALYNRTSTSPVLMNRRFTEMLGYTREELAGFDTVNLIHPEDRDYIRENNRRRLAGEKIPRSYEYRCLHKDGRIVHIEASFDPLKKDGQIIGIQGFFRDVTEKKKAEQELKESAERYRVLFEMANDSIAVFDENVRPILFNEKFHQVLGYKPEEVSGLNLIDLIHPEDRESVTRRNRLRFQGEEVSRTYEFRVLKKNGDYLSVEGSFDVVQLDGRRRVQGILRDITERKTMERRLLEKQKERTLTTLAGGIAHDFNNILLGIMGNAGLLKDEVPPGSDGEEMINSILSSSERLARLTKELLDYSRAGIHQPREIDLNQVVMDSIDMVKGSLGTNVLVDFDCDPDVKPVHADPMQIQQVFLSLCVNANEAMPEGGTLSIRTRNLYHPGGAASVHSEMEMDAGNYACIQVSDTGIGMTQETMHQVFDPFYTTKFLGRGLGLAASAGIMKNHRGSIRVESHPGIGSTFTLYLPEKVTHRLVSSYSSPREENLEAGRRVLIVDDDEVVREVTRKMFQRIGFETLVAGDGDSALSLFEELGREIHLVFLDIQIPGIGGGELFSHLIDINPEVRVVVNSGYDEEVATAEIHGRDRLAGFIQKPYTATDLERLIASLEAHA